MEEKFSDLKIQEKKDINILLLGETGVGKSTFINSIANYLHHKDFKKAKEDPLFYLIPCMFNITDGENKMHKITIGTDSNEYQKVGSSATQDVKTYVFPIGDGRTRLRLIDSPGMGDPRGVDQDDINCENILSYIGQLHELHAICFLFKPNDSRITVTFEYCVKQILSRLEKSAARNIIFIFTNTKGTHYKPGETIACLKQVVQQIRNEPPHVDIKVDTNVFSFDNEAFRYLAAVKNSVVFGKKIEVEYQKSWKTSSEEAEKLIIYIAGNENHTPLKPHFVKSSTSINEARRLINQLGKPLADISQLILDNLRVLDRREIELKQQNLSLDGLRSKLYVPIINLRVIKLTQPATVCCDAKCAECVLVDGIKQWNYKQRCHDPCYLKNVPHEIVGAPQLRYCASMDRVSQTCLKCRCAQTVHMHIYYMSEKFDDKKIDNSIQTRINTTEKALIEAKRIICDIKKRKEELEKEKEAIIRCAAKFAAFLQKNAITPFNDAYRKYLDYMIFREERLGKNADQQFLRHLRNLLLKYDQIKETFDKVIELPAQVGVTSTELNAKDISGELIKLYALKHNGGKIKELYTTQKSSRRKEYEKTEYVHSSVVLNVENKAEQRHVMRDIAGNVGKKGDKKKQQNKRFKQYKSKQYLNKDIIKNGVKTVISGATGSDDQIKIEITKIGNSNPRLQQNFGTQFSRNADINHSRFPRENSQVTTGNPFSSNGDRSRDSRSNYDSRLHPSSRQHYGNRTPHDSQPSFSNRSHPQTCSPSSYDNCPPPGNRTYYNTSEPSRDNNARYDSRESYDDRSRYDRREPHDDRARFDRRAPYDDRARYGNREPYDDRARYDSREPYDDRARYDKREPYDDRARYDSREPYDDRARYDKREPHDDRARYGSRELYDDRARYNRLPYEDRPLHDCRPPYDNRSSFNVSRYDNRTNNSERTYFQRSFNDNKEYNTSQTTCDGRTDERTGSSDNRFKHDYKKNVPPPSYDTLYYPENRKTDAKNDKQAESKQGRPQAKYQNSGERYSSNESD